MPASPATEPITVRSDKDVIAKIDALAAATERSRNYIVNQALRQYLDTNAWQIERINEGMAAADDGKVIAADKVFSGIAAKHGWKH